MLPQIVGPCNNRQVCMRLMTNNAPRYQQLPTDQDGRRFDYELRLRCHFGDVLPSQSLGVVLKLEDGLQCCSWLMMLFSVAAGIIIIIIIINDNVYGALLMTSHCESSPGSFDECRLSAGGRQPSDQANRLGL